jgi:hypothetical protein
MGTYLKTVKILLTIWSTVISAYHNYLVILLISKIERTNNGVTTEISAGSRNELFREHVGMLKVLSSQRRPVQVSFKIRPEMDQRWSLPSFLFSAYGEAPSLGTKRPGRKADDLTPSSAEGKNSGAIPPLLHMLSWRVQGLLTPLYYMSPHCYLYLSIKMLQNQ